MKWRFVEDSQEVRYFDNPPAEYRLGRHHKNPATPAWHKRPSIFMPRWASRITLEIVNVRVERVQDISEDDARAEGVEPQRFDHSPRPAARVFEALWQSINAARGYSWESNPWVWVVEFKRI